MKPAKAIEILQDLVNVIPPSQYDDRFSALKLGIEALKQILQLRAYAKELYLPLLPGETEE